MNLIFILIEVNLKLLSMQNSDIVILIFNLENL